MIKNIFLLLSAAIVLLSVTVFTNEIINNVADVESIIKAERHVSEDAGYSIQFPAQWEVMEGIMGADVIALAPTIDPEDLFRENVNIIFSKLDFPISREEYYALNLRSLAQLLVDFDLEESQEVQVDGVGAKKIVFTHTMGIVNAKVMQYLILDEDHAYVMTFTSDPLDFKTYRPKFEEIANSFRFDREPA